MTLTVHYVNGVSGAISHANVSDGAPRHTLTVAPLVWVQVERGATVTIAGHPNRDRPA